MRSGIAEDYLRMHCRIKSCTVSFQRRDLIEKYTATLHISSTSEAKLATQCWMCVASVQPWNGIGPMGHIALT